jgi:1-deoxy-D-xylulose-5-phosphate reductoisomerase
MRKKISILGSTGSIGRQTLEVVDQLGLEVCALAANYNIGLLETQIRKYRPAIAAVYNPEAANLLKTRVADLDVKVVSGPEGLIAAAVYPEAETVVTAVVGMVGLKPTLAAIQCGKRIALANKETLVCAGELVMRMAREYGAEIIPVDSEHSAIFQCLEGSCGNRVKHLILTASGGPFRGKNIYELAVVSKEQALKNPNWDMGAKVTIDSATLMNKGLEFIEAMHLFSVSPDQIQVLIHPESIIHSMIQFEDNSVIAQLSRPDMRLPIQYALTYPQRMPSLANELDLVRLYQLTFDRPDLKAFRCLELAMKTARVPGTACAVLNAANEVAVQLFLNDETTFNTIYELCYAAVETIPNVENPTLEDILAADAEARKYVDYLAG